MHLRDDGLVHVEQRHAASLRAFQMPGVVVERPGAPVAVGLLVLDARDRHVRTRPREVVPCRERSASPFDDQAVNVVVMVRFPRGFTQLRHKLQRQRVELIGSIQRDPDAPVLLLVDDVIELRLHRRPPVCIGFGIAYYITCFKI